MAESNSNKKQKAEVQKGSGIIETEQGEMVPGSDLSAQPAINIFASSTDQSILLGEIKAETAHIKERLDGIEKKIDEIMTRLEEVESFFNIMELMPKPIGPAFKKARKLRLKRPD